MFPVFFLFLFVPGPLRPVGLDLESEDVHFANAYFKSYFVTLSRNWIELKIGRSNQSNENEKQYEITIGLQR